MSDEYSQVRAAMAAGTPHDLICRTCPWTRQCVQPPGMTEEQSTRARDEMIAQGEQSAAAAGHPLESTGRLAVMMMAVATYGWQHTHGAVCPVFVARLQSPDGRGLSDGVKAIMRGAPAG